MSITEDQITIAAALYRMRAAARTLSGDRYTQQMSEIGILLKEAAVAENQSVLLVATNAAKHDACRPMDAVFIMAAAVELLEPSA